MCSSNKPKKHKKEDFIINKETILDPVMKSMKPVVTELTMNRYSYRSVGFLFF